MWKFRKKKFDFPLPARRYLAPCIVTINYSRLITTKVYPRKMNLFTIKSIKDVSSPQNSERKLAIMSYFTTRGAVFTTGMRTNHSQQVLPACS